LRHLPDCDHYCPPVVHRDVGCDDDLGQRETSQAPILTADHRIRPQDEEPRVHGLGVAVDQRRWRRDRVDRA